MKINLKKMALFYSELFSGRVAGSGKKYKMYYNKSIDLLKRRGNVKKRKSTFALAIIAPTMMAASQIMAGVCNNPDNQVLKAFNAVATTTSHYVGYVMDMWIDQNIDFGDQTIDETTNCALFDPKIGCNEVRSSALIGSIEIDNLMGEIYVAFRSNKGVHPLLRGASITLTPIYCQTTASSVETCAAYENRLEDPGSLDENDPSENQIKPTKWQCLLEGPQSDFRKFTLNSVTCNFISESMSSYDRNGSNLNVIKDFCSAARFESLG